MKNIGYKNMGSINASGLQGSSKKLIGYDVEENERKDSAEEMSNDLEGEIVSCKPN